MLDQMLDQMGARIRNDASEERTPELLTESPVDGVDHGPFAGSLK